LQFATAKIAHRCIGRVLVSTEQTFACCNNAIHASKRPIKDGDMRYKRQR